MILQNLGDNLQLTDVPAPCPQRNEILLKVLSCGLNFADTLLIQGKYQQKPDLPFSPGLEVCGIIEHINCSTSEFCVGDRVIAIIKHGGLAEKIVVNPEACFKVPKHMTSNEAATLLVAYGTSYMSLKRRANLKKGENLLVLGASGGVGLTAIEIGISLGANVIAVASDSYKLQIAKEYGASHLFESKDVKIIEKIKSIGGADVIYDPVGGELSEKVFRTTNQCARIIPIGFASGHVPNFPLNIVMIKNIDIIGVHWSAYQELDLKGFRSANIDLIRLWENNNFKSVVTDVFSLQQANEALGLIQSRKAKGKVVIDLSV